MKTPGQVGAINLNRLLFILLATPIVLVFAQSPLDDPGQKKITVRSEIKRGYLEMSDAVSDCLRPNLLEWEVCLSKVIEKNRSRNTDSDAQR